MRMKGMCGILVALLVVALASNSQGARILGIFTIPSKSHNYFNLSLMRELAARGHQVTVVGCYPQDPPLPNYTDIVLKNTMMNNFGNRDFFSTAEESPIKKLMLVFTVGSTFTEDALEQPTMQQLIHDKDLHFDLIILTAFSSESMLGFAHKFKAPVVTLCPFGGTHWMGDTIGNPNPYAHVPDVFTSYTDHMNFLERLQNTVIGTLARLAHQFYHIPKHDAIMRKYFHEYEPIPYVAELNRHISLILVNQDISLSYPRAVVPNLVQVGGMHIVPPKALPQDLQKYMDEAPNGVIFFSMGSLLQSSKMPEVTVQAFMEVFSKLKQKVIWKWEIETIKNKPANVRLGKWFPQNDILAHPNLRLFITHGGLLSSQEAVYHSVPVLGIPVLGDQNLNMARAEAAGYGLKLNFHNITAESLQWALTQILEQPSYRENAKKLSQRFRDRPESPMQRAVFWIEYVLRHKGAYHLRSAALDLTWYQYHLLDVLAMLLGGAAVVILAAVFAVRTVVRRCTATGKKQQKVHKVTASKKTR